MVGAVIAALLAMSGLVLATAAPAFACKCQVADADQQTKRADAVFVATVDGVTEVGRKYEYAVTATHLYKGTVDRETTVTSNQASAACGLGELKVGTDYVFLVTGDTPPYAASYLRRVRAGQHRPDEQIEAALGAGDDDRAAGPTRADDDEGRGGRPRLGLAARRARWRARCSSGSWACSSWDAWLASDLRAVLRGPRDPRCAGPDRPGLLRVPCVARAATYPLMDFHSLGWKSRAGLALPGSTLDELRLARVEMHRGYGERLASARGGDD